jgi:hypothetical protein
VDLFLAHHVHQLEGQQAIQPYRGTYQPSHLIEKNDRPNCNVAWIMAMGAFSPTYYYAYLCVILFPFLFLCPVLSCLTLNSP